MLVFENLGNPLTCKAQTMAADTCSAPDDDFYQIKIYSLKYDSGGTTYSPVCGDLITAHDNAWYGICLGCTIDSGTWAGGDAAGKLYLYQVTGTIVNDDVWNVVKATDGSAIADEGTTDGTETLIYDKDFSAPNGTLIRTGMQAKAAIVVIETNAARIAFDGSAPTSSTLTNGVTDRGVYMAANTNWLIKGITPVRNIRLCNATASSNMSYRIIYYF